MADTKTKWQQRVADWLASGETADTYSKRHGFAASTLRWWSSKLGRPAPGAAAAAVRMVQLVRPHRAAEPAPVRPAIIIELLDARARICVECDVDRDTLAVVLELLGSRARGAA